MTSEDLRLCWTFSSYSQTNYLYFHEALFLLLILQIKNVAFCFTIKSLENLVNLTNTLIQTIYAQVHGNQILIDPSGNAFLSYQCICY